MAVIIQNYRAFISNTLKGFADVRVGPFTLHDVTIHEAGGRRWVGLPAKPQISRDGTVLRTPKTGRTAYSTVVSIDDPDARERFRQAVLDALDALRAREGT